MNFHFRLYKTYRARHEREYHVCMFSPNKLYQAYYLIASGMFLDISAIDDTKLEKDKGSTFNYNEIDVVCCVGRVDIQTSKT